MTGSVEPFDIPDDSGSYPPCHNVVKGLVFNVEKCEEHDHFVEINSLGDILLSSASETQIVSGGNINLSSSVVDVDSELLLKQVASTGSFSACVSGGRFDVNKVIAWLGAWSANIESRVSALE